jgi:glycosyltransferase involved in cell wall biosynthesis
MPTASREWWWPHRWQPEPFGRVVLEAQAMARPVVATNMGGPQETVVPNETGWLVKPGDVTELSNML